MLENSEISKLTKKPFYKQKRWWVLLGVFVFFLAYFPDPLFSDPNSTVILDRNGRLLSAQIATDGQWRFPEVDSVPKNLEQCILLFEDEYFYSHIGFNPISILRAFYQNLNSNKVVSGGSTISMQVIRLSRKNPSRTYWEKLLEIYLALRLEAGFSKEEILKMYVSHAPYGGNVVGVEAASWRYFSRSIDRLSWAEYALLAVLPNAPSLLHPGKNADLLLNKRNRLLQKLADKKIIDETTRSLAAIEPLPFKPKALPDIAYHILSRANVSGKSGQKVKTTIDFTLQETFAEKLNQYLKIISQNEIYNACGIVLKVETGEVLAYLGNASNENTKSRFVDLIEAKRSSGSILKPFLYGKAFESGLLHPNSLMRDVPVTIGKYAPQNFDKTFSGMMAADKALARSLNIPAALLLREYGLGIFHENLKNFGFSTIEKSANHYGLTLILGGAEVKLWDVAKAYQWQANQLAKNAGNIEQSAQIHLWETPFDSTLKSIDPAAWWQVSEALSDVIRPGAQQDWQRFSSSQKIAWKTGTSHGFRDAWAAGYNAEYLVAVWVGNADGEGRPGLTGVSAAAPLMFNFFDYLKSEKWFYRPEGYFKKQKLCAITGKIPNENCPSIESSMPDIADLEPQCSSHSIVFLNEKGQQANRDCAENLKDTVWFHLDPVAGYFYRLNHPSYRPLPSFSDDCGFRENQRIAIIYPTDGAKILLPKNFSGVREALQLQATHAEGNSILYWHLNESYIGSTTNQHRITITPTEGQHKLLVMDEDGNEVSVIFSIEK